MHVPMHEVSAELSQLSECRYALMLGVLTPQNRLEDFLKFSCAILNVKHSVLVFENEPYVWHYSEHCFGLLPQCLAQNFKYSFYTGVCFPQNDEIFINFRQHLQLDEHTFQRLIGFQLKYQNTLLGYLYLYDDSLQEIEKEKVILVEQLIHNLMHTLQLYTDNAQLHEEYEQQISLNFSKNKYLQILSHDLRAPFHGLIGFADVLLNENQDLTANETHDIVHYLHDTLQSTYQLLESVLKWSMADGGRFIYHPLNFKLKAASSIVCKVLNGLAQKKKIEIIDEISADIEVYADIHMITSVIQNLVSNALKFSPPNKQCKVTLSAYVEGNTVKIHVQDHGLGMSQSQLDQLFSPDLNSSVLGTAGEVGAGLGLVLCKRFIELNLGMITVKSEPTKGTTFIVCLPLSLTQMQQADNLIQFSNTSVDPFSP